MDYREAGVDVAAGRTFVDKIRSRVESTYRLGVLGTLGGFGGCFELPGGYQQPVLVSGTDGVGTKLKIAQTLQLHYTIGIDLVAMCVNDVLTSGAEPLFFLDYLATSSLNPEQLAQVVEGIVTGCQLSGCALLGGETAEMPGFYQPGEYDLAGFCVGIVEKSKLLDGTKVAVGDQVIALASSGVHSNGFSLVRKIVETQQLDWESRPELLGGKSLGEVFLTPTQIYVLPVLEALRSGLDIKAMAHITGGGIPENLPRCLGNGQSVAIKSPGWKIPPVFTWLAQAGSLNPQTLMDTFNLGVGFTLIVSPSQVETALAWFSDRHLNPFVLGEVVTGDQEVLGLSELF